MRERVRKMKIENNILKHYLQNVYFITGTAYAGKSTMVKMLAKRYGMICCGENYHMEVSEIVATPETHPDLCYTRNLTDWRDFVTRTPEEYGSGHVDGFINIPVDELRDRIDELPKDKPVYVMCQSGVRSYIATRILEGNGFTAFNLAGGYRFYEAVKKEKD